MITYILHLISYTCVVSPMFNVCINYEFHSLIFTQNLSRLAYVTIRAALGKNCSRALPLHSYRSRGAESPFSRSDAKGSHRTPAWKLIVLRFEKIDLVQQNDFPHRILRYLTYTCVLYSHENTIFMAKIDKFRRCTHHGQSVTKSRTVRTKYGGRFHQNYGRFSLDQKFKFEK